MKKLTFTASESGTLGVELEFQIINPESFGLVSRARDLIHDIKESPFKKWIKPEITQSMIEINSSVQQTSTAMLTDLHNLQAFLIHEGKHLQMKFCGGGAHPFQAWKMQKIYPTRRYKTLARQYRHLSKEATVFGQHVHVGCQSGDDAIYLTHAFARYVPQLLALSASSPFYQGIDTGYNSTRSSVFNLFPLSGVIPFVLNWKEFTDYFNKMRAAGIVESMKDFYWDIRPKPEFGTIEIRVCDTPLTIKKAVQIAAYIQALTAYLVANKPLTISRDLYFFYGYNRFQGARYGFDGEIIPYDTKERISIQDDILKTLELIQPYLAKFDSTNLIAELKDDVLHKMNDAKIIKNIMKEKQVLRAVVAEQCNIWSEESKSARF